ncbi:MAG: hypothetical protein H6636_07970 [Anaerolineales bacterium]|nr:hypothetical protein [Anaerolineales bacterium]
MIDLFGAILGFLLTCMVLSYLFGDNPLFRFSVHLFVGVAAGFAGAVAVRNVLYPNLILPLLSIVGGDFTVSSLLSLIPVVLSLLLLAKLSPRMGRVGNLTMAFLVGVGAAIAIGGAITGTLFPQTNAAMNQLNTAPILQGLEPDNAFLSVISGFISISVTILTLLYFQFSTFSAGSTQRPAWLESLAFGGQIFIALTFGVVFAGVYATVLTALIDRLYSLLEYISTIWHFFGPA